MAGSGFPIKETCIGSMSMLARWSVILDPPRCRPPTRPDLSGPYPSHYVCQ